MTLGQPPSDRLFLNPRLKYLLCRSRLLRKLVVPRLVARHHAAYYGRPLPRDNPLTLSEKINWAKAWGDVERYAPFADKYQVRHYIASVAGENHLVPLLAVADRAADLDWDLLPAAFVLKTTHGSGWNIIVRDKASADRAAISARLDAWLSKSYFALGLESQYAPVKPRIIAEVYLGDPHETPPDYKINCALGVPLLIQADYNRHTRHTRAILDLDWRMLPMRDGCTSPAETPPRPANLSALLDLAGRLSRPFPFVRVDCYAVDDRIYVGELTFAPGNGFFMMDPPDTDLIMGRGIDVTAYRRPLSVASAPVV